MRYGTGSVRTYATKSGTRYSVRYYDQNGNQHEKRGFTTKTEANKYLRTQLKARDDGTLVTARQLTVAALLERWMAGRRVALSTLSGDERRIRLHVLPALGSYPVAKITPELLAGFYRSLQQGLSANSVRKIHALISSAFTWAMSARLVSANPAKHPLSSPPSQREVSQEQRQMSVWDAQIVSEFIDWCPSEDDGAYTHRQLKAAWMLALLGGLRRSEICGLRWSDIDVDRKTVTINKSITEVHTSTRGKVLVESSPKSGKSRTIVVSPSVFTQLDRLPLPHSGRIFDISPESLTQSWTRVCRKFAKETGAPALTLHELRHTHASLLLRAGVHPKIVQERLGHATITITMDTYSHLMPSAQAEAAASLDSLLADGS